MNIGDPDSCCLQDAVVGGLWVPPPEYSAIMPSTSVPGEAHPDTKAIAETPTNVQDTSMFTKESFSRNLFRVTYVAVVAVVFLLIH
ncbi:hypothetical protein LIER_38344 [Lithospermum erythrorhizon]|uniref:Uncharacterized protein n=1 Tax=Lithospermum erythrorhizon TaxID=34254 RepID=A0AAV3Q0G4_LITER